MHDVFKLSNQIMLACALSLAALLVLTLQFHSQSGVSLSAPRIEAKR